MNGLARSPCALEMLITRPQPCRYMCGSTRRASRNGASSITRRISENRSGSNSGIGATCCSPALLTSTSTSAGSASTASRSDRSQGSAVTAGSSAASALIPASSRSTASTRAPSAASRATIAAPIPLAAPVTRAVRPASTPSFVGVAMDADGTAPARRPATCSGSQRAAGPSLGCARWSGTGSGTGNRAQRAAVRRRRRRLADERAEAKVYRELAGRRQGEEREILLAIAEAEERHAAHWEQLLGADAGRVPRGNLRSRVLAFLARRFGSVFVLALVQQAERRSPYDTDLEATRTMAADERVHEEVVRGLAARGRARVSGLVPGRGVRRQRRPGQQPGPGARGGRRAARAPATVLLTGLAGLLSGALSMGAGEYISVRSQRELLAASTPHTADAPQLLPHLDVDANELALVYRARGIPADEAQRRADALLRDTGAPVDVPQDEDADDVVGSGWSAALSSFAFFGTGAAVPVLPFLVGLQGVAALLVAGVLVGIALMATGATVGVLSGGPPLRRALRQLAIGAGAAAITYLLGSRVRRGGRLTPSRHSPFGQLPG